MGIALGPVDAPALAALGLGAVERSAVLGRAVENLPRRVRARLGDLDVSWPEMAAPAFVAALNRQPRAGATFPGCRRLVLLPAESHGDHCLVVAVGGVLLADHFGADPGTVLLAGLAHHLHNARLADAGFAGEVVLGEALAPLTQRLFAAELATLAPVLAAAVRKALDGTRDAATPEGRAFHAADVLDRVHEVHHHAAAAAFRAADALVDMQIVHPGPLQAFQADVLREAGL